MGAELRHRRDRALDVRKRPSRILKTEVDGLPRHALALQPVDGRLPIGQESLADDGLPPAASRVREEMTGESYSDEKDVMPAEEMLLRIRIGVLEKGVTLLEGPMGSKSMSSRIRRLRSEMTRL